MSRLFGRIIYFLECTLSNNSLTYKKFEKDPKFCDIINIDPSQEGGLPKVKTWNGYNTIEKIYKTKPLSVWRLQLEDGTYLDGDGTHIIYKDIKTTIFLKDIVPGLKIITKDGYREVKRVIDMKYKAFLYDISIREDHHSYFSNKILSHNTTTTVAYLLWYMLFNTDRNIAIVANKGKTSTEIIKKLTQVIQTLPFFMKPGIVRLAATSISFENGCYLNSATTNPTSITGQSVNLLYMDEAAHIPENLVDEFWKSVFPTLSSFKNCQLIISSTPKGKQNLFYRLYDGSCKGLNSFKHYRVDWWQVPGRDEEWEKRTRRDFGDEEFDQEYGLQFDVETKRLIRVKDFKLMERIKKEYISIEFDGLDKNLSDLLYWHPDFHPDQLIMDDLTYRKFLFVIDTAEGEEVGTKGKASSDYNIINIFEIELLSPIKIQQNRRFLKSVKTKDVVQYRQVGIYIDQLSDEEQSAQVLKWIIFDLFKCGDGMIDNSRVLIEMNFNGKNYINKFKEHPNFYEDIILKTYHTQPIPGQIPPKKKFGYLTKGGAKGKNYYCELGAKMIANRQILISQYDDKDINRSSIGELQNFGKNKKGSYEGSCVHDDISVTILFVSRVNDIEDFMWWIEDWMDSLDYHACEVLKIPIQKVEKISELLHKYQIGLEEKLSETSDDMFNALYMSN